MNKQGKCINTLLKIKTVLLSICTLLNAEAQRGGFFESKDEAPQSPSTGFPGIFDPHTAKKGNFVFDLPSLALDYGVTERLTLGTSGWLGVPIILGIPAIYAKARYRFIALQKVESANTVYAGYLTSRYTGASSAQQVSDSMVFMFSNNTRINFAESSSIGFSTFFTRGMSSAEDKKSLEYVKFGVTTAHLGLSYQNWFNNYAGPSVLFLGSVYQNAYADSSSLAASSNAGQLGISGGASLIRAMWEIKIGNWLISPSLVYLFEIGKSSNKNNNEPSAILLPWINVAVEG